MTRRQRMGHGGRDYHGCGDAQCPCCGNRRPHEGPTRQELLAELDERDQCDDQGPAPESVERCKVCGTEGCA